MLRPLMTPMSAIRGSTSPCTILPRKFGQFTPTTEPKRCLAVNSSAIPALSAALRLLKPSLPCASISAISAFRRSFSLARAAAALGRHGLLTRQPGR